MSIHWPYDELNCLKRYCSLFCLLNCELNYDLISNFNEIYLNLWVEQGSKHNLVYHHKLNLRAASQPVLSTPDTPLIQYLPLLLRKNTSLPSGALCTYQDPVSLWISLLLAEGTSYRDTC